ncbi:MAG: CD1871A family CXXC motif-containing protein [Peptoniphilus sp.]|nr:CD1871A family CXXC motif-containing protein [Peptoniphilus sp.]
MGDVEKRRKFGRAFLILGIVLLALGIYRGEMVTVFRKAVVICLECIGID